MSRDALQTFVRDLGGLYSIRKIYPSGNDQVRRAALKAAESLSGVGTCVRIARLGDAVVVEDRTLEEPPSSLVSLVDRLERLGCEGLQFDPDADGEELQAWMERVFSGDLDRWSGRRIRIGTLQFGAGAEPADRRAEAAAGYLSLLPEVRQSLAELAQEKSEGLDRARQIVRVIAGQVAGGGKFFDPIRELRAHDDYTFTHALNVCVLTSAICRVLGVAQGHADVLALAAFCHDIGKEKVPPEILNKQGQLDPEERSIMDLHPVEGASILLRLQDRVHPLLPVVAYQHHRGPEGGGYPAQPSEMRTHPASLLVAIADVYDALRTLRSYQAPLTAAGAFSVMMRQAREGVLHPPYVGAFARLLGVLAPGARVTLSDGAGATVLAPLARDPLKPAVGLDSGETVRLEETTALWIETVADA